MREKERRNSSSSHNGNEMTDLGLVSVIHEPFHPSFFFEFSVTLSSGSSYKMVNVDDDDDDVLACNSYYQTYYFIRRSENKYT